MTLFKQLFIAVSFGFLLLMSGIELIYVNNAKTYLQDQLASHAQDVATSLSMVLPSAMESNDRVRAETVVSAVFDRGYYQAIQIVNPAGETVVLKNLSPTPPNVPSWLTASVKLETPAAEAMISKGWRQLGRVIVTSHPNFAYQQLWRTTVGTSIWLLGLYIASLLLLHIFLKGILRPLQEIEKVAHAISEREFKIVQTWPSTRELRAVVNAINILSAKIREIIDAEVAAANHFRADACIDELTKLDNRRSFEQQLHAILETDAEIETSALYLIKMANFKDYNATKGYQEGDNLLKLAGSAIANTWRNRNFVRARFSGATFAVAAFNLARDEVAGFGHELCDALRHGIAAEPEASTVTFGCGAVFFKDGGAIPSSMMAVADMAMLQSISKGDNSFVLLDYPADKGGEDKGSLFWKEFITNALNENRCTLLVQSVEAFDGTFTLPHEITGRLIGEDGQLIPAAKFMPMAIRHNLAAMVDMKLIEKIFSVMKKHGERTHRIAINLSTLSIGNAGFMEGLGIVLAESPEIARRAVFEFSEFGIAQDLGAIEKFVAIIRKFGADFAVDNFGLHHSAFEYLQTLRPAYIKLGPAFIKGILYSRENQFFISSIVKITKPLEVKTIALGAEDQGTLEMLRKLGMDGYQGFSTGAPLRID